MIIKIHQTVKTENALMYNERKVKNGVAEFFDSGNTFSANPFQYDEIYRLKIFADIEKNSRVKNKCLHISVNPSNSDYSKLGDETIRKEIGSLLEHLGYENQPYFVYKHADLERVHFHVVSTRIDKLSGKKIKDSNERQKVQQFINELNQKYGLKGKYEREELVFRFSPRSRNIKQSLEELFQYFNGLDEITSKELYEEALRLFNVEIRKSRRGHIVVVTDEIGNLIRYPICLSNFKNCPEFYASSNERVRKEQTLKTSLFEKYNPYKSLLNEMVWQSLIYKRADARDKKPRLKKKSQKKYRQKM
ncbi:MAG: relaxase/mobilization nuclease domain-containing protein [Verrucomicrobiales bacterium]|nr:relaxase/mobilization nuclease domain-containing protein [Verrucomicrobiales bacterium]